MKRLEKLERRKLILEYRRHSYEMTGRSTAEVNKQITGIRNLIKLIKNQ